MIPISVKGYDTVFYINPGEMRTQIRIQKPVKTGTGSFSTTTWIDLGNTKDTNTPKYVSCRWTPKIKSTVTTLSDSTQSLDFATITIRYRSDITAQCRIVKDRINYLILSISDPTQHLQWMQIDVKAAVMG